jgi:hypothetical protein
MMFQKITRGRTCPVCKSPEAYRVKRAGLSVKIVCKVLNLRPQWCPQCDTFFLGPRHSKKQTVHDPLGSARPSKPGGTPTQADSLSP